MKIKSNLYNSNSAVNLFRNNSFLTIIPIITPISTVFSGLIWVFGLYQLENRNGRIVLCAAYISMVITSIVVAINSMSVLNNLIGSGVLDKLAQSSSSSYSQLFSNYTWIGSTAIISLVGNSVTYILFVLALFIPYKRIKSGEFVPIRHVSEGTESIRRCPNCGRAIPFDARVCPYCAKRFEEYVST